MKPFNFVPVKTNIEVTFTWDLVPCEHMYVTVDFHSRVESHENTPTPRKGAWVSDSRSRHLGGRKSHVVTPDYKRYLFKRPPPKLHAGVPRRVQMEVLTAALLGSLDVSARRAMEDTFPDLDTMLNALSDEPDVKPCESSDT